MCHTAAVLRLALLLLVLLESSRAIGPLPEASHSQQVCLRGVVAGQPDASVVHAHRLCGHNSSDGSFACGPFEGADANLDVLHVLGTEDFTISAELMLVRPAGRDSATSLDFISPTGVDYLGLDSGPAPDTFFTQGVHWPDQTIKGSRTPDSGQWFNLTVTRASGVLVAHVDSKQVLTLPMQFALDGFALRPWRSAVHVRSLTVCAPAIPAPPPPPPPPSPPEVTVFVHGEGGCSCIGIPALILTRNRTVLAFAECRMWQGDGCHLASGTPTPKNPNCSGTCIVMKRSSTGGATWSQPHIVAGAGGNVMPVFDAIRGRVVLNYALGSANDPPYIQAAASVMVTVAETDGPEILSAAAWSTPRQIAKYPGGWANHPGPNPAVQLRAGSPHAGRLVFSGWLHNTGKTCSAVVWFSDDGGESFAQAQHGFINGTCEVGVSQMDDGRVVLLGNDGAAHDNGPCPGNTLQHYFSTDGGDSFGPVICDHALVNADCQAPVLVVGRRIVVANPEGMPLGTRTRMTVHASDDVHGHNFSVIPARCSNGTASWGCFDTGDGPDQTAAGYSSLTFVDATKPHTVGLAWETSGPGATCAGARCRVLFSVFDVPQLPDHA
jgi:sialidase-1